MPEIKITITIDALQVAALSDLIEYMQDQQRGREAPYNPTLKRSVERSRVVVGNIQAAYQNTISDIIESHYNPKDSQ